MGNPGSLGPDFDTWYEEQHPLVLAALTVASGRPDVAADATDEAFVRAYERWERVRRMDSPGGWLYRVALNDLRRRCRRQALERELLRRQSPPAPVAVPIPAPDVWEAVRRLPTRQRTAVALRYILDLSEPEVARVMGVSRGSASASLVTARRTLEARLADDESAPVAPSRPGPSRPSAPGLMLASHQTAVPRG
jgi:RNA polymerase sigma-70 factor (ECF subfamily)